MNYIWEAVINHGDDIFIKQAERFSPFYEISPGFFEKCEEHKPEEIEVNSLYRFENIFSPLFFDGKVSEEWKTHFFDVCMHMLIYIDLKRGYSKKEYRIRSNIQRIEQGCYGRKNQTLFKKLDKYKKHTFATYLDNQYSMGASTTLFAKALIDLLGTGILYRNTINPKEIILYVGAAENEDYLIIIKLVEEFFLPLDFTLRVFWDTHFGLMGEEQTVKLGKNIVIF